MEIGFSIKEVV